MEGPGLPLLVLGGMLPILLLLVPPLVDAWRRRGEAPRPGFAGGGRKEPPLRIPSAEETAESVRRFQLAVDAFKAADAKGVLTESAFGAILRRR